MLLSNIFRTDAVSKKYSWHNISSCFVTAMTPVLVHHSHLYDRHTCVPTSLISFTPVRLSYLWTSTCVITSRNLEHFMINWFTSFHISRSARNLRKLISREQLQVSPYLTKNTQGVYCYEREECWFRYLIIYFLYYILYAC